MAQTASTVNDQTLHQLAYDETVRRLENQRQFLGSVRSLTATLFGSAVIATSFFGSEAFRDGIGAAGWVGLGCFILATVLSAYLLLPTAWMGWPLAEEKVSFTLGHDAVLELLRPAAPAEVSGSSAHAYITKCLEERIYQPNVRPFSWLCKGVSVLSVLVGVELIALMFEFI
jgi:hypothetical protein